MVKLLRGYCKQEAAQKFFANELAMSLESQLHLLQIENDCEPCCSSFKSGV